MNLYEWEGTAGKPATKVARIDYDYLHEFDVRQADSAVAYIKQHAKDDKPFFMDVNFMKMHNPNIPAKAFTGKSHLGNYSDAMLELDSNIGRIMDAIRARGTRHHRRHHRRQWRVAGCLAGCRASLRSAVKRARRLRAVSACPASCGRRARFRRARDYGEMMSHIDCWATLAAMVGLTPPPTRRDGRTTTASRSISTASTTAPTSWARRKHSARNAWIYIDGESFGGVRADIGGDPENPDLRIAWKYLTPPRTPGWVHEQNLGAIGSIYNLTMDPYEKYDMTFNGAVSTRMPTTSPGRYAGYDNGWAMSLIYPVLIGVRQIHREVSEHQTLPRRSLERHDSESSEPGKPAAFDGYHTKP